MKHLLTLSREAWARLVRLLLQLIAIIVESTKKKPDVPDHNFTEVR